MQATLREFETHLPEYLSRALAGEEVTLTQQGKTVLKLSPVPAEKSQAELEREAVARLDALPWVTPGDGGRVRGSDRPILWPADEKPLSQLVLEDRE